jgi:Domain of unknown function (DUF4825)
MVKLEEEDRKGELKMEKLTRYLLFSMLTLLLLNGCNSKNNVNEDIFQYRNSYIGDNSAVGNIINQLPSNEQFIQLSLQTNEEPYGMVLEYEDTEASMTEEVIRETVIYNATYLFALVKNAEWITFNFGEQEQSITREELQKWYGKELREISNGEDLKKLIQTQLEDENKLKKLFKN